MHNEKKKLTGTDMGIVFSIVGIVASIFVLIMDEVSGDSLTLGFVLLCSCSINLAVNIDVKKSKKDK